MAHYSGNLSFLIFYIFIYFHYFRSYLLLPFMLLSFNQAAQLAHILNDQLKEFSKEVVWEKVGKDAATKTAKDKIKAADAVKKRAAATEKALALAKKRLAELTTRQNETDLKLPEAASLNVALNEELTDLRAVSEVYENKWYDEEFTDAEEGVEPAIREARQLSFQEGWMAALHASGVLEDSYLKDPSQIPFLDSVPATQNPIGPVDKEETDSLRELVEQIDAYVEVDPDCPKKSLRGRLLLYWFDLKSLIS